MVIQANKCLECDDSSLCKSPESTPSNADCGAVEVVPCRPTGILVIEDAQLMLKALTETLRKRGFVVWAAPDGREGVDLYRCFGTQIDIVLSDVQRPVRAGPKAIDSLRESSPLLRFCFMTGDTRASTHSSLMKRGAMRIFTKPFPSVAAVAEELWHLARQPHGFSVGLEPEDDRTAGPEITASNRTEGPGRSSVSERGVRLLMRSVIGLWGARCEQKKT